MNLNRVFVIGNLTRDPELKSLPSGSSVCNFSIATNRTWTDKASSEKKTAVEYHNIVIFGKMADTVAQYMKRGSQLLVEGRLQTRSWEKDGKKNYRTEVVAESVQFGAKPKNESVSVDRSSEQPDAKGDIPVEEIPY